MTYKEGRPRCLVQSSLPRAEEAQTQGASNLTVFIELVRGSQKKTFSSQDRVAVTQRELLRSFSEVFSRERGESEELMTVGWFDFLILSTSSGQAQGSSRGRRSYRDIAHCDVSSYFWLIRAIMSPALIYVVIPPQQSCIDRS